MTTVDTERTAAPRPIALSVVIEDGIFAGVIGAAIVALWFFLLDVLHGHPLYTPALLGTVILEGPQAMRAEMPIAPSPVAVYTGLHFIAFILFGIAAAYLWELFDRHPPVGIVLVFAFVIFETGFFIADLAIGAHVLGYLGAWTVGVANLLAAAGMGIYLWVRHPRAVRRLSHLWTDE